MDLSTTIARTEAALDQAISERLPITMATVSSLQEGMLFWSGEASKLESDRDRLIAENANLRALLKMPDDLAPTVFTGNVVPLGSTQ